jgi:single-stranded-DNA-specific exonuclease
VGVQGKHLKLTLQDKGKTLSAIGFSLGNMLQDLKLGELVDVVYIVENNVWNGNTTIQLKVKDIRIHQ